MSKLRALLVGATAAGAFAAASFMPAHADHVQSPSESPVNVTVHPEGTGGTLLIGDKEASYLEASGSPDGGDVCGYSVDADQGGCLSDVTG